MLTPLRLEHGDALERFLLQFDDDPNSLHGYFVERNAHIGNAVELLEAWAVGDQLAEGWVPCTTRFWEVDGELGGVINVRHYLSDALRTEGGHIGYSVAPSHRRQGIATWMLSAGLDLCRELGIERALLHADTANVGSWKAIEYNNGQLEGEALASDGELMRTYWIDLRVTPC